MLVTNQSKLNRRAYIALQRYRSRVSNAFRPTRRLSGLFYMMGTGAHRRYQAVAGEVVRRTLLDVGSSGKSFLSLIVSEMYFLRHAKGAWVGRDCVSNASSIPF